MKSALLFGQYSCNECVLLQGSIQIRHLFLCTDWIRWKIANWIFVYDFLCGHRICKKCFIFTL